jgi:hypothetical protein
MSKIEDRKNVKVSDVNIDEYSLYQLCRWSALEEAVNIIGDKCEDRNIDFETIQLNPLDIYDYVEKATDLIYAKYFTT